MIKSSNKRISMKKHIIICSCLTVLTFSNCTKSTVHSSPKSNVKSLADEGQNEPVVLNTIIDSDNTANAISMAIEASLQPNAVHVKIGGYGGGTDTAKLLWTESIKADIAASLGITVEQLEDMNGIELLVALFPAITSEETNMLSTGADVTRVEHSTPNSFSIYAGPMGSDEINTPALILNFQLN